MKPTITLVAGLALVAAACGGGSEPAATDETTATTAVPSTTTTSTAPTPTTTTTTTPPTTTTTAPLEPVEFVPGADADVDAVVEAYVIVFDSTTSYEEKVPYLVEPEGLEETVLEYAETGDSFGGVSVEVSAAATNEETAAVVYTLLFAGNPAYAGLDGDALRTEAGWQITRKMFCSLMTSARVGCPSA